MTFKIYETILGAVMEKMSGKICVAVSAAEDKDHLKIAFRINELAERRGHNTKIIDYCITGYSLKKYTRIGFVIYDLNKDVRILDLMEIFKEAIDTVRQLETVDLRDIQANVNSRKIVQTDIKRKIRVEQ